MNNQMALAESMRRNQPTRRMGVTAKDRKRCLIVVRGCQHS